MSDNYKCCVISVTACAIYPQCIKQLYQGWERDPQLQHFEFDGDKITLDLPVDPDPPVKVGNWEIVPLTYPQVTQ